MKYETSPAHAVIILAAGGSRRLGTEKQLIMVDGESLLNRTIRIALETRPQQALVVLGHDADRIHASISERSIERVDCQDWKLGMSASLRTGIQHVNSECQGALILLCDQPALTREHLQSLVSKWYAYPESAVASAYANTVGVPALLPRSWFESIRSVQGDQGARSFLRQNNGVLQVSAPELAVDVDKPGDVPANFS